MKLKLLITKVLFRKMIQIKEAVLMFIPTKEHFYDMAPEEFENIL